MKNKKKSKMKTKIQQTTLNSTGLLILTLLALISHQATPPSKPNDEYLLIVEMTRHGSRGPAVPVQTPTWVTNSLTQELTPVGERQHYLLGLNTRKKYSALLNTDLGPTEYYIRSTNVNRTIMSAMAHGFGVLTKLNAANLPFANGAVQLNPPLDTNNIFYDNTDTPFTTPLPSAIETFPIHTQLDLSKDILFGVVSSCPAVETTMKANQNALVTEAEGWQQLKNLVERVANKYSLPGLNWLNTIPLLARCAALGDYAAQDYRNNPTPVINPFGSASDQNDYTLLQRCYTYYQMSLYKNGNSAAKVFTSPLLNQILVWFDQKVATTNPLPLKYALFSGHDTSLEPFLYLLNILGPDCQANDLKSGTATSTVDCQLSPGTASQILWELIKKRDSGKYVVKFTYNGKYYDFCGRGGSDEYGDPLCTLDEFKEVVRANWLVDYGQICGEAQAVTATPIPPNETVTVVNGATGNATLTALSNNGLGQFIRGSGLVRSVGVALAALLVLGVIN